MRTSEFVRFALRCFVGCHDDQRSIDREDIAGLRNRASIGDVLALRELSRRCFDTALAAERDGLTGQSFVTMGQAFAFASLAAMHGDEHDILRLSEMQLGHSGLVAFEGDLEGARQCEAAGLASIDALAECGSELAADTLQRVGQFADPVSIAYAKRLRAETGE